MEQPAAARSLPTHGQTPKGAGPSQGAPQHAASQGNSDAASAARLAQVFALLAVCKASCGTWVVSGYGYVPLQRVRELQGDKISMAAQLDNYRQQVTRSPGLAVAVTAGMSPTSELLPCLAWFLCILFLYLTQTYPKNV